MRKTGVSATSLGKRGEPFELDEAIFKKCAESNIDVIEVCMPFHYDCFTLDFKYFDKMSKKYNVDIWSFHIPFSDYFDPSSLNDEESKKAMADFKTLIKNASQCELKNIVIHPSAEITTTKRRDERMQKAKVRLSELADYAAQFNINIAVETLPRLCLGNCTDEMEELISLNDKLKICFDINHIELGTQKEFVERLGHRIATLHVADYKIPDEHLLPFEGNVDWKELIIALDKANYNGPFLYEASIVTKDGTNTYRDPKLYYELHKKIEDLKNE